MHRGLSYYLLYLFHVTQWSRRPKQGLHTTAFIEKSHLEQTHIFTMDAFKAIIESSICIQSPPRWQKAPFFLAATAQDVELKSTPIKGGGNLTGGDRFTALFIMLQWAYPIITSW